jgi:CHASE2 domain-containing sensor protein/tRNA A-37 threonylcarbamoyl transferase component Bud32
MKKPSFHINQAGLFTAVFIGVVFAILSLKSFSPFESLGRIIYSIQMRLDLPQNPGANVISIVNIDDKSLKQLGPWPWPRKLVAEMISILKNNGAKMIVLDLLFKEKEQNQGLVEIRGLQKAIQEKGGASSKDPWLLSSLTEIEKKLDSDSVLTKTVKESQNVYLPLLGTYGQYDSSLVLPEDSFLKRNSLSIYGPIPDVIPVNKLATPFSDLAEASRGLGHINLSPNSQVQGQEHVLFLDYRGNIIPSLPFRVSLDYFNRTAEQAVVSGRGVLLSRTLIPTRNGEILIRFKGGSRSFPYYSFVDILSVGKVPAVFDGKIVLIGYTAEGAPTVSTPVDPELPQVELTANVIDNLISGRYLKRPGFMVYGETVLLMALCVFTALVMPRYGFINRMGITVALIFAVFLLSLVCFMAFHLWFKIVYIGLALFTLFVEYSALDIIVVKRSLVKASKESVETNRMLGLSLQSQGLLDLAFEKFRKIPLDDAMKDVVYNLGLDYERKRMLNKAIVVYEYISTADKSFRDLSERIPKIRKLVSPLTMIGQEVRDGKIVFSSDLGIKPTVGRYEILGELGQGAMGIVYKARDPKINRLVAIKTIRFSDEFEESRIKEIKDRFFREAEIAGKLSHPSIVSIYDVGEDYDLTYMAMELLEGESLHKFCRKGSLLPLRKLLFVVAETALALDYAHSQGVIHRDVKPANIMLLKDGKVKVTDFGIAKAVSTSQTKSGVVLGTPNYMSPEQINGHNVDNRSDIFSLGVVFFELLTGQLPFRGKNITNLFYEITQGKTPSPRDTNPKIPKPVEQIVEKALAKEQAQRFQTSGEFAKYLRAMIHKIDQAKAAVRGHAQG